jgi:membrane associated rhomboid family serine protease
VHWAIDAVVAFLLTVIVALFLGASLWFVAIGALLVGLPLAPWTRRAEERALARREPPAAA